ILVEPDNSLIKQYTALLSTEGITLRFSDEGLRWMARISHLLNQKMENIGARRLHTVVERVLQDISFEAPSLGEKDILIDQKMVDERLRDIVKDEDVARYIL
ncbi:MAG: HslU--HslV peptidase ATPase subunit, partial [Candidatus Atribacteria bacterium]|nr:HslU--HslV peptidase ATPase subunit [Candidatus Atribacteria bacterium]